MNGKQRSVQFRKDAKNSNFMKRFIHLILLMAFTVGCSSKRLSEHEAICHISGDGIDVKKVRVCLVWADMWNGDAYQEIKVKDGSFDAEVILDTNQVYELCVPHPEYGFATYRSCEFFYTPNGIRFGQRSAIDGERIMLLNATGTNKTYCDYINERDSLYMGRYEKLMKAQDSLNNIGLMYDPHWLEMCDQQNDESLPQSYRDSITIEVNKMSMSGEHRTPEGQMWQDEWHRYRSSKQKYDLDYLSGTVPGTIGLYMIMDNIHISQQRSADISGWLNLYDEKFKDVSPSDRMHDLITTVRDAAAIVEGRQFIDFTLPDQYGTERTLSESIEGKTAVLELWASWCRSCRVNARSLKPLYEKYHNSGFEVIGIAREYRTQAKWLKALEEDAYPWPNMVALEDSHHIWTQYGCPDKAGRTLLIDKNGIIVKIDPSKDEIEQYIKENI